MFLVRVIALDLEMDRNALVKVDELKNEIENENVRM